jgi:hypothetical protein
MKRLSLYLAMVCSIAACDSVERGEDSAAAIEEIQEAIVADARAIVTRELADGGVDARGVDVLNVETDLAVARRRAVAEEKPLVVLSVLGDWSRHC